MVKGTVYRIISRVMGNRTSDTSDKFVIEENPNRRAFVSYVSRRKQNSGGLFSEYVVFTFNIRYLRYYWTIHVRYNELVSLHRKLLKDFPSEISSLVRPDLFNKVLFTHNEQFLDVRAKMMTKYIQSVLDLDDTVFESKPFREFIGSSVSSFDPDLGRKGREGYLKKSSGGYVQGFSRSAGDFVNIWKWRWVVLSDSSIIWYKDPQSAHPHGSLQLDQNFTIVRHGRVLTISTKTRKVLFYAATQRSAEEWETEINRFYARSNRVHRNRYESSFVEREKCDVKFYTTTKDYMLAVTCAILKAQKEIMITDWKNSPGLLLTKPPYPPIRLDQLLKYKADQGVKIYILLYKEVENIGQGNNSSDVKKRLERLSNNIHVIRHPNKFIGGSTAVLWSHHEKLVVVDRNSAFVGGVDLAFQRWDDELHRISDEDGLMIVGNEYRQPASETLKPIREINAVKKGEANPDDDEDDDDMVEVDVTDSNENLPQALSAIVDDDQPYEVAVVVDFGFSAANNDTMSRNRNSFSTSAPRDEGSVAAGSDAARNSRSGSFSAIPDNVSVASENAAEDRDIPETAEERQAVLEGSLPQAVESNGGEPGLKPTDAQSTAHRTSILRSMVDGVASFIDKADNILKEYNQSNKRHRVKKSALWEKRDVYPRMPWHDVQAGVSGVAARDLAYHFIQVISCLLVYWSR